MSLLSARGANVSDLKALQKQLAEMTSQVNKLAGEQQTLLFREFALEYLRQKLANPTLRTNTKRSFENQVENHLISAFGALPMDRIKNGEWLHWVTDMREQKKLTRFFNARKVLIEILHAATNDGHIEKVPKLDNPDEPKNVGRVMEISEIISLIWRSQRPFRAIFFTFWKMGCRPREILQWEWSMFKWAEPGKTWISVPSRISKTGRQRDIPLNPEVSKLLHKRYIRGNRSQYVFPAQRDLRRPQMTYQSAWSVACRRANVKDAKVYDLRRTFITRCASEGKPLIYVAKCLDTSTKMIESVYAKAQIEVMEGIIK
jgi:integrase